jgi:integrase/recombinase XerD
MQIRVRQGKGAKDRNVVLSRTLLEVLRRYFLQYRPKVWLFYGETPQRPFNERTIQRMVQRLSEKAGLRKGVSAHTLRHYAESRIMPSQPGPFGVSP